MSHKSEMAGPFIRGDTIINKHFTFTFILKDMSSIPDLGPGNSLSVIRPSHTPPPIKTVHDFAIYTNDLQNKAVSTTK